MGKLATPMNKWSLVCIAVFAAFLMFSNSASADNDAGEYVFFRIDSEIDVLIANKGTLTLRWWCTDGTGFGEVQDGTASESTNSADGIIKVASSSKEMTDGGCIFNTSDTLRASASIDGWVTTEWTGVDLPASGTDPFTTGASMDYTIRVNGITDELSTALTLNGTTASASYDGTVASQSYSNYGGTWRKYIAGATTGGYVTGGADGYVNRATTSTLTVSATASTSVDFGVTATASAHDESGLLFGHKVQVFQYGGTFTDSKLTTGTVLAGDSLGTTCTMGTSTNEGYWYCPVPLAHTGTSAQYTGTNFKTTTESYTDRTTGSDV